MSRNGLSRYLVDDLISYLAAGGTMIVAKSHPKLTAFLSPEAKKLLPNETDELFKQLIRYMRLQNLIGITEQPKGNVRVRIASGGTARLHKITLARLSIPRPKRWDKRWRVVFFDIPESKRQSRNSLVAKLKELGFYQLQKSTWVHPFACKLEVEFIKRAYKVTPYVTYAEIENIDRHSQLVRHFRAAFAAKKV